MLMLLTTRPGPPFVLAWRHTEIFWAQIGAVIAHHPVAVIMCAAVPAVLRGYVLLQGSSVGRGRAAFFDIVVTLWRVLLLGVAVWAACSGREWRQLREQVGGMAAWQIALGRLGWHVAHHLRLVLWELLFLVVAFVLLHWAMRKGVRAMGNRDTWLRDPLHRVAVDSVLRNLVLGPLLVIYLVEMARPAFQ